MQKEGEPRDIGSARQNLYTLHHHGWGSMLRKLTYIDKSPVIALPVASPYIPKTTVRSAFQGSSRVRDPHSQISIPKDCIITWYLLYKLYNLVF